MSGAEEIWSGRGCEAFEEEVARLRAQGCKVTVWWSELTGYQKAVFVQAEKVTLLEVWEKVTVYYGDDFIQRELDVVLYERGRRPELVCDVRHA